VRWWLCYKLADRVFALSYDDAVPDVDECLMGSECSLRRSESMATEEKIGFKALITSFQIFERASLVRLDLKLCCLYDNSDSGLKS
jgi:hypothetical protein